MWLRRLLVALYGLEERSAHSPDEVSWDTLPERCVLQIHWPRSHDFVRRLKKNDFHVVVVTRHPLDVLLSILQFAPHESETARWLDGHEGDERAIVGTDPLSPPFRDYAAGRRARALLGVSPEWWKHAAFATRYEDLVADAERELLRLCTSLPVPPLVSPRQAVTSVSFASLAAEARNRHFWQGRAGHWRELLPQDVAVELARPFARPMRRFGYGVDADPWLVDDEALERWLDQTAGRISA